MTFGEFVVSAMMKDRPPHQRQGQWAFNLLYETRPEIANTVRAGPFDPFYDDNRLAEFFDKVSMHWDSV